MTIKKIAILGEGVTATAVRQHAQKTGLEIVAIEDAEVIIASPGIPPSQFPITDTPIISEIEWAYRLFQESGSPPTLIAVTGTNGKSTVTAMISHILDIPYAGNIGIPLINYVGYEYEFPELVVEVSSYQLETCVDFRPDTAVFLNLSPDHLSRHGTLEAYGEEKAKCFINQTPQDTLVYNEDDKWVQSLVEDCNAEPVPFSATQITQDYRQLSQCMGPKNMLNACAAIRVAETMGKSVAFSLNQLITFKPLRHRMEWVTQIQKRTFINDSKATNPESTLSALESFEEPIHVMLCGDDKGLPLEDFIYDVQQLAKTIITFGGIASRVCEVAKTLDLEFPVYQVETMQEAIDHSLEISQSDDIILLSPSSSSYDQFNGFEDRGNQFCEYVLNYAASTLV